ncbi:MAG: BatA domain-containing protein [Candidatus Marinimicrobia bacterium]|nr:BatA domain-containing protein [Candidatus Neomarinimicrobiota bacterium]
MTFLQPLLIVLGVLAGVPFIIHLMGERKYQPLPFSSLKFLREIERDSLQKLHLRQWLILLLRALWITMLVFVLAQPFLNSAKGNLEPGIMIIDKSFSTQTDKDFSIVENKLRAEYPRWNFIEYTEISHMDSLRNDIQKFIDEHKLKDPNIIILSDLQDNPQNKAIMDMTRTLSGKVFLIPAIKRNKNYALTGLISINTHNREMKGLEIQLSGNEHARKEQTVHISLDGKRIGHANTNIQGYAYFYFGKPSHDHVPCVASCPNDEFPEDNIRYLVIKNLQKIKILCVNEISEGHYHINALRAMEEVEVTEIFPEQLPAINLDEFDMLWISGLYPVNGNLLKSISLYSNTHPVLIAVEKDVKQHKIWEELTGIIRAIDKEEGYYKVRNLLSKDQDKELMIKRYYKTNKPLSKVLWETEFGDPLLAETKINIFLLLTPFQFDWNEMGLSPYFTRVLSTTLLSILGEEELSYTTHDAIPISGAFSIVTTPAGERYRVRKEFIQTDTPGFYTIENENELKLIAVNIPGEECVQALMEPEMVRVINWDGEDISGINKQIKGRNAQILFYILALLFIIFEMLLLGKGERTK